MHLYGRCFACLDFYGLIVRQNILFGIFASYFRYGVFSHTESEIDFTVFIRFEFLLIGIAHEVSTADFEGAPFDLIIVGGLYHL